ncbi:uncharacterized protein F4807DRAFT_461530 [Annulohypoxylon truncatum]|uniref:uncharacterized protein n=1 Tax=Annulohypoxylon truncatum TaxID=327061 RepID=UPI002008AC19|nr:uncharacterized protein F4807DRAFT_461530 [Annulohypoxylon truncatum]KAI1208591.1 hypothetical protein F4807DRAFT_461530 [Annulohypoxylon truncatum]
MSIKNFEGKSPFIHESFEYFLKQEGARRDANAYLNRQGHLIPERDNWIKATTAFTDAENNKEVVKFAVSDKVLLIGNRSSFSEGQYPGDPKAAGMSMIHIFAISRANYFNAVSLRKHEASIINDMINFFREQWKRPEFREAVLAHQRNAIENQGTEGRAQARQQWQELKGIVHQLKFEHFAFGFHLWPDNTVAHLHMHIIAMPEKFRRYSTRLNDAKTVDAHEVRAEVKRHDE